MFLFKESYFFSLFVLKTKKEILHEVKQTNKQTKIESRVPFHVQVKQKLFLAFEVQEVIYCSDFLKNHIFLLCFPFHKHLGTVTPPPRRRPCL